MTDEHMTSVTVMSDFEDEVGVRVFRVLCCAGMVCGDAVCTAGGACE
jgi:hypothetical protein